MLQPSSFALFLFLGAYLLYYPGMKPETVGILGFCVGAGLISMALALFGRHPWVKKMVESFILRRRNMMETTLKKKGGGEIIQIIILSALRGG